MQNVVVYGFVTPLGAKRREVDPQLMAAMMAEFKRNGGVMLTHGKVRHLRRLLSRQRRLSS